MRTLTTLGQSFASLAYGNCRDFPVFKCFIYTKSILRKNVVLSIESPFQSLGLPRNTIMLTTLFSGRLWSLKTKENFKLLTLKVVAATFERWLQLKFDSTCTYSSFCSMKGQEITPLEGLPPYSRLTNISPSNKQQKLCGSKCQDKCPILVMPEAISID